MGTNQSQTGAGQLPFVAEVGRTTAGSFRVVLRPVASQRNRVGRQRHIAAILYDLAAEMERRSEQLGARWVVSPEAFNARLDLELTDDDDEDAAAEFVMSILADAGLA